MKFPILVMGLFFSCLNNAMEPTSADIFKLDRTYMKLLPKEVQEMVKDYMSYKRDDMGPHLIVSFEHNMVHRWRPSLPDFNIKMPSIPSPLVALKKVGSEIRFPRVGRGWPV